jgi:hypothetical protein
VRRPDPSKPYSRYRGQARRGPVVLPPNGCEDPIPKLPAGRRWTAPERALWRELWTSPQAEAWDESAASLVALFVVHTIRVLDGTAPGWAADQAARLGDRLGLSPAGLQALNWAIGEPGGAEVRVLPSS